MEVEGVMRVRVGYRGVVEVLWLLCFRYFLGYRMGSGVMFIW